MNPMDWFEMHDQREINRLNDKIKDRKIIYNIVKGIHVTNENKHKLMNELVWSIDKGDLEYYESLTNMLSLLVIIAAASVVPNVMAGGMTYNLTVQGATVRKFSRRNTGRLNCYCSRSCWFVFNGCWSNSRLP